MGDREYLIHFNRRKFCDRGCMAKAFDARPIKPDPSWMTAHWHARKACSPEPCAICGSTGRTDVHHKDENWRNNSPQGFPDNWTDIPWRGKAHAPDGPRYKALGNSMAVNVMEWLLGRIAEAQPSHRKLAR